MPPAIEQLGAKLSFIDQDELAWGDLSKYDAIVTGVRAYERRADLRAYNRRLLDYVERGGTVIVQYNKLEFNQAQYGPYPAKVSGNRVSDETVPVKVLAPNDPVFYVPEQDRRGDLGELGPGTRPVLPRREGSEYVDLVSMTDSFKDNPGESSVSLVEARAARAAGSISASVCGASCRPGTGGAYQLLANLPVCRKSPLNNGGFVITSSPSRARLPRCWLRHQWPRKCPSRTEPPEAARERPPFHHHVHRRQARRLLALDAARRHAHGPREPEPARPGVGARLRRHGRRGRHAGAHRHPRLHAARATRPKPSRSPAARRAGRARSTRAMRPMRRRRSTCAGRSDRHQRAGSSSACSPRPSQHARPAARRPGARREARRRSTSGRARRADR